MLIVCSMESRLFPGMDASGDFQRDPVMEAIPVEPPRLRQPDRAQVLLEPVCLDQRLAAEHPARLIWEVVRHLDLAAFHTPIAVRGSEPGRPATDAQLLVAVWLYATVDGVGNRRKLDRRCRGGQRGDEVSLGRAGVRGAEFGESAVRGVMDGVGVQPGALRRGAAEVRSGLTGRGRRW
jgi:hypothetical protein